ncbi:MAG: 4Fe-4S binding protein [Rikenellaceae bacterium]|nr:4Fe-4S binding protein [Rikenellaceae bacterium]
MKKLQQLLNLILVTAMLVAVAVNRDGRVFGNAVGTSVNASQADDSSGTGLSRDIIARFGFTGTGYITAGEGVWEFENGITVYSSSPYAEDITGFAGETPLYIAVDSDNIIVSVIAADNNETPDFWDFVVKEGLLDYWNGKHLDEVLNMDVDAVSGATMSSLSVINSVRAVVSHITRQEANIKGGDQFKSIAAVVVLLAGVGAAFMPNNRNRRTILLVLNVIVLGFWCGYFISFPLMVGWVANGIGFTTALALIIMLVPAVLMPYLGKGNYYCSSVCPYGALQELAGKFPVKKRSFGPQAMKIMKHSREAILMVLLFLMWISVTFEAINYEPFSVFLFKQASIPVLTIAGTFLVLSVFINRPYCRFVCPTGEIIGWSQRF